VTIEAPTAPTEETAAREGVSGVVRERWRGIRQGDVGSLPIIVGLLVTTAFFTWKNENFFTAVNFNNLVVQMAGVATIAIGVVFVLLLGEIDLSIGYMSGVAGVIVAELQLPDGSHVVTGVWAILIAVAVCSLIGALQGSFVAIIGVPSFVVTLAGLLACQGIILRSLPQSVIIIQDNRINDVANYYFSDRAGLIIAAIASIVYAVSTIGTAVGRRRAQVATAPIWLVVVKIVALTAVAFLVVSICNRDRGLPFAGLLVVVLVVFWTYIAKRTTFGRHVYAVGGNAEASRRAGINVARVRIQVFMISGAMAAVGGVIFAARLRSVDLSAGGGTILLDAIAAAVIGGTSLFGGRGEVRSALLGALVIAVIANGIDLVGYSPSTKYITTAVILLAAVTLDTLARRRLEASGR
jgi:D-xylose transport system permease protein